MWTTWNDIDRMFRTADLFRGRMDRLFADFDRSYRPTRRCRVADSLPRTNLYDRGDHFEIKAEVPGLTKEDLNVKIQGNYLEVSGTRKSDAPEGYTSHRNERGAVSFTRSFTLPSDVEADKVEASLKNGILTLTLPKTEAAKPQQITIH